MKHKLFLAMGIALAVAVTGCSSMSSRNKLDEHPLAKFGRKKEIEDAREKNDFNSAEDAGKESILTLGGGEGGGLLGGGGGRTTKADVRMDKLFAGAVDVVMELPVMVADRNGGFVSTDWKVNPNDSSSRYRLNIHVTGREPYGEVGVVVLKQQRVGDHWEDRASDPELASQIEKAIRKRAQVARP
ncbi:MAG: DUF3576 domain-containing protein [Magnetococcales bacterium]|nr:DUF3576 domain-containing protein [Magnetococcales bacterium]NGZ26734.1 DUF3576 domain-containing protein [Magnetococcales bacterium]